MKMRVSLGMRMSPRDEVLRLALVIATSDDTPSQVECVCACGWVVVVGM